MSQGKLLVSALGMGAEETAGQAPVWGQREEEGWVGVGLLLEAEAPGRPEAPCPL